jgi:hypothetical protein
MKHINHNKGLLVLLAGCMLVFAACNKQEPKYSFNKGLNTWAIKNMARYENFSRAELAAVPSMDTQGTIYATLPAATKYNIWKEKLLLAKSLVTTDAEKAHLQSAIDYVQPEIWESAESMDAFNPWAVQWGQTALTQLGWDSTKLFLMAETWLLPDELLAIADRYNHSEHVEYRPAGPGDLPNCACRVNLACEMFFEYCGGKCGGEIYKCGILGTSKCIGICIKNKPVESPGSGGGSVTELPTYYIH